MPSYGGMRLKDEFELKPSVGAIKRILKQKELTRKPRKKHQKKNDLRQIKQKYKPFRRLQVDVKYLKDIPNYYPQMKQLGLPEYQYTARDVKTGAMFLSYSYTNTVSTSIFFIERILKNLKKHNIPLKKVIVQTDNGGEFGGTFKKKPDYGFQFTVEHDLKAHQRFIPPGMSNANADVETVHNTIEQEYFDHESFASLDDFMAKVTTYQYYYNLARLNYSKGKKSPLDILLESKENIKPTIFDLKPALLDKKGIDINKQLEDNPYYQHLTSYRIPFTETTKVGHHVPVSPVDKFFLIYRRNVMI